MDAAAAASGGSMDSNARRAGRGDDDPTTGAPPVADIYSVVALACCAGILQRDSTSFKMKVEEVLATSGLGTELPGWSDWVLPGISANNPRFNVVFDMANKVPNHLVLCKLYPEVAEGGKALPPGHVVRFCVVVVNSTLHVVFRGSANILDFVADIGIMPMSVDIPGDDSRTMVPSGMLAIVKLAEQRVLRAVNAALENAAGIQTVVFSGYSFGGAVATIMALRWQSLSNHNGLSVKVRTFGAPQTRLCPKAHALYVDPEATAAAASVDSTAWENLTDVHNFVLYGDLVPRLMLMDGTAFSDMLSGLVNEAASELTTAPLPSLRGKLAELEDKADLSAMTNLRNSYVIHGECTIYFTRHANSQRECPALCFSKADPMQCKHLNTKPSGSVMDGFADHKLDNYVRALSLDLLLLQFPELKSFVGTFRIRVGDRFVEHKHEQAYLVTEKNNSDAQLFKAVVHDACGTFSIGSLDGTYWRVPDPGMTVRALKKSLSTGFRMVASKVNRFISSGCECPTRNSNLGIYTVNDVGDASKFLYNEQCIVCQDDVRKGHKIGLATETSVKNKTREPFKLYCTDSPQCERKTIVFEAV